MAVTVKGSIMAAETATVELDFTPAVKAQLVNDDNYNRPRDLYALIYNATVGGSLVYPPLALTSVTPTREGITLGFVGVLRDLGSGDIGPMITDREYVSGQDKLDNGGFELGDLYWVRTGEDSRWVLASGTATNAGGLGKDDPFEVDRKFPTRPGYGYRATATGVSGTGRLRIRTIYEGARFNPPNKLANWLSVDALTIGPIAKPQLFNFGAGPTTLGPTMAFSGGTLTAGPNPRPTYNADAGFETGAGWSDVLTPAPMSNDIDLVNLPAEAAAGSWVMRVGPVTQHQLLANSDMENGLANWYSSSEDADPDPGLFYSDPGGGIDGSKAATTDGAAFATRVLRYLRADASDGGGVTAYDVKPGEQYLAEALVRAAPSTDGTAYISLHIPHPTVANRERWYGHDKVLEGDKVSDDVFRRMSTDLSIPANRFKMDALFEVHDCTTGFWAVDNYTITRTRGNRAQIQSDTTTTVVPGTRYQGAVLMRSGGEMQVGSVRVGYILTGSGVDPRIVDVDKGSTDYEWTSVAVDFTPDAGYTTARRFVAGLDIVGEPAWIDNFQTTRMNNNSDTSTWASVAVVADQRYLLQVDGEVLGATEGSLTVGVKLTGPALADEYVPVKFDAKDNAGITSQSVEVKPPPGYTGATLYAQSTDISGGTGIKVHSATLTKMDNNTAETVGTAVAVTPERTYKWSQEAMSGANLQRGTVTLSVACKRSGYDDIVFDSAAMEATAAARKVLTFDFTPPSGYDQVVPRVIGTDVEGDNWNVGRGELRDTDTGTVVFDAVTINPAGTDFFVNSTAPDGAESVRVAVIVEQGTTGWSVDSVSLKRTGVTPATGAAIVADLLKDPETGLPLSIAAGTINAPAVIPHDWLIQNMTNRAALEHLCNVVYPGGLEFRINPTLPPTIDVGPPGTVFDTHDPADALLPEDIDVEDLSDPTVDVEERPTVIRLFGAERRRLDGSTYLVTAEADVPGAVEYDLNNRAIRRVLPVHDGTVDHQEYADTYASDLAARAASAPLALTAKLSGKDTRADMPPGDTTHVYEPESGLEDVDNPTTIEGKPATPRAVPVLERERHHGPSYRVEMRASTGTTFELPGVLWSDEDATVLTLGDRLPDWSADPQGMAPGIQYLRDRASRPR